MESKGHFNKGKEDGKWIWYYENGQIKVEGIYKAGNRVNQWITYNENGSIKEVKEYTSAPER